MPWGIERLNARKSQPNPNIVFIKPLPGPGEKVAQGFLERVAAQCVPIMRRNHIHVMSLEEYEPNREFVGRNFNAGEVIQLVLRSARSGRWLPFEYVQMVMMHELAHCRHMNHSRAFWGVRNSYVTDMHKLWAEGYTGDGLWGRGASLGTGEWEREVVRADEVLPEHLCGGTFRSRKRKRKPKLSYQERKERRVLKKFGKNGVALGADDETKVKLEKGKRKTAKPRVANSARGRELRAAAALARLEQQKEKAEKEGEAWRGEAGEEEDESESGSESDYEDEDCEEAVDVDGRRIVDGKGRGLVKVCQDEDGNDAEARNEVDELRGVLEKRGCTKRELPGGQDTQGQDDAEHDKERGADKSEPAGGFPRGTGPRGTEEASAAGPGKACGACSLVNDGRAETCAACANVLDPERTPGTWRCGRGCAAGAYANSGDCGVCGLCGQRRG